MSGEYSEGEARPWIGSHHWWGFDEPMGAAKNVFEKINRLLRRCVVAGGSRALCGRCGG